MTIIQNPTISLVDDVAVTTRALATQDGPAILVGHSYGGVVVTEAGNDPKVAGLVYIAAFAPASCAIEVAPIPQLIRSSCAAAFSTASRWIVNCR